MAEIRMSDSLEETRRQLRNYLIPSSRSLIAGDVEGDHFPRSKVMRFAFNPRNRRILLVSGSILGVVVTRLVGAGRLGVVAEIARSLLKKNTHS
jgi:predicted Holliday junction resolvase-like endonuclease